MKGDFLGFSFDGIHCSDLGITHVSSSDRYDEDLFGEIKDKTIEIPNNHGEYYYGSTFGTRTFEIDIAYDSVTEKQFRQIRRLFGTTKICPLVFDERPYKVYYAKVESPIQLSYICFDEEKKIEDTPRPGVRVVDRKYQESETISVEVPANGTAEYTLPNETIVDSIVVSGGLNYSVDGLTYTFTNETAESQSGSITFDKTIPVAITRETVYPWKHTGEKQRIYKGEGTISLICYFPFARQLYKTLDLYREGSQGNTFTYYTNVDEWSESSGLLTQEQFDDYHIDKTMLCPSGSFYTYEIPVYNAGDLNTGFCLYLPFEKHVSEKITVPANTTSESPYAYKLKNPPIKELTISGTSNYTIQNNTINFTNPTENSVLVEIEYNSSSGDKILPADGKNVIIIDGDQSSVSGRHEPYLVLKPIERKPQLSLARPVDEGIVINTVNHLIEGVSFSTVAHEKDNRTPAWTTTGNIYNDYIVSGTFPQLISGSWLIDGYQHLQSIKISCAPYSEEVQDESATEATESNSGIDIYYNYLYF